MTWVIYLTLALPPFPWHLFVRAFKYLSDFCRFSKFREHLDPVESNVMSVTPGVFDIDCQLPALGKRGNFQINQHTGDKWNNHIHHTFVFSTRTDRWLVCEDELLR